MLCSSERRLLGLMKGALFSMAWVLEDEVIGSPRGMEGDRGAAWTKTMAARAVNTVVIFISFLFVVYYRVVFLMCFGWRRE